MRRHDAAQAKARPSCTCPAIPTPSTTRSPEWVCPDCDYFEEADEEGTVGTAPASARADRQQHFFTQLIFELRKVQRRFAFIAQHFKHGWTAFVGHFHAAILEMHDVHLERLDLKVPIVAAAWTSQRHSGLPHPPSGRRNDVTKHLIL